jgi:Na+/proline symporter
MKLGIWDGLVILFYLFSTLLIGLLNRKKATSSKEDYILGGNKIPWWMLGISNASGMFDISGTIWMVSMMFIYGVKSIWLPWLWPVFNQVFLFAYLAIWLRKSNVSTGAEWMLTRFGKEKDAMSSHYIIVAFALLSCLGFLAYGFIGLGKFIEIFIPYSYVSNYLPFSVSPPFVPHFYGIIFTMFAVFYTILGGMSSIVWADILQFFLMTIACFLIGLMAIYHLSDQELIVPDGWKNLFFGIRMNLDWGNILPVVNKKMASDKFEPFSIFFSLMVAKGILSSIAGPAPNYDMQKILSSKNPREAALLSMFVNFVLLPARYLMITGFTVLAILYFDKLKLADAEGMIDFEKILPAAIQELAPAGLLGLFLVGLLAAFMGTFAGTLNAAQAYLVNDVYLKSIKPNASRAEISKMNYFSGIFVVIISILMGLFAKDVNSILQWIVGALYVGYIASNALKWHWWRLNSNGYFAGMLSGIVSAMIFPFVFPHIVPLYYFPLILIISSISAILGSLLTPPTNEMVLVKFYKEIRPWGFWSRIDKLVKSVEENFESNKDFKKDLCNVLVGITGQTTITVLPVFIILLDYRSAFITFIILIASISFLWKNWYLKLPSA